jgi:hypothetical protein
MIYVRKQIYFSMLKNLIGYTNLICFETFLCLRFDPWRFEVNSSSESLHVSPEMTVDKMINKYCYWENSKMKYLHINVINLLYCSLCTENKPADTLKEYSF